MKFLALSVFALLVISACRPAAAPVSVSNRPLSANDLAQTNLPLPPSKPFPEMSWTDFGGATTKLKELKGKVVILDFWATNCPPCIEEIPHLSGLQNKYGADNLQVVGLHVGDEEDRLKVPAFAERLKIDYPLAQPEDALNKFIFAEGSEIPQTAVFDREGRLVRKFVGFDLKTKNDLDKAVEQAIKQ